MQSVILNLSAHRPVSSVIFAIIVAVVIYVLCIFINLVKFYIVNRCDICYNRRSLKYLLIQITTTTKMDYQCIVVYTIVRISPFYPAVTADSDFFTTPGRQKGCLDWVKGQIKRYGWLVLFVYVTKSYPT